MVGLAGILILHLFFLVKLKFTAWPEMLTWPYLAINGLLPYKDIAIAHTPLLVLKLSTFFKLFGVGILQLQIFTWLLILLTDVLLFFIVKNIWNRKAAIISLAAFALLQLFFDGNGLWFETMMSLFGLLCFYFIQKKNYFNGGLSWALAIITKQTGIWLLLPIILSGIKVKKFILGAFVGIVIFSITLLLLGLMPAFFDWAINFGIFVLPQASGQIQLPTLKGIFSVGFVFSILMFRPKLLPWAFAGTLGAYPRFEYFHIQPAVPYLAIALGLLISEFKKINKATRLYLVVYFFGLVYLLSMFFVRNFNEGIRFYEQEVRDVVSYVKANTVPGEKIFVLNWWDSVYPLSDTLPATSPLVPQLSWYQEIPGIQEEEIMDLQDTRPSMVLLKNYSVTGLSAYKPMKLYNYVMENYKLKEEVSGIQIFIPK